MAVGLSTGANLVHAADDPAKTIEFVVAGNPCGGLDHSLHEAKLVARSQGVKVARGQTPMRQGVIG